MSSLNKVTLIGNLGADPDIRNTQAGDPIANLSLATSERWRDKRTGENRERTEWHRVVMFGPLADIADRYLRKGSKIYVEGKLQTRKWEDQHGNERYSTEVVCNGFDSKMIMLSGKDDDRVSNRDHYDNNGFGNQHYDGHNNNQGAHYSPREQRQSNTNIDNPTYSRDLDDEVPF